MAGTPQAERITALVAPALTSLDLVVEDVEVTPAGKRRLVRIAVDRDLSGLDPADRTSRVAPLTLDEIADATRTIDDTLDEAEPFGDAPYVLEVSSPGVQRSLNLPRHFRRNVGRLLRLTLREGGEVTGRLVAASPETLELDVDGATREITPADVARARVQVEFSHADDDPTDAGDDLVGVDSDDTEEN